MDLLLVLFMLLVSPANLVFNQLRQLVAEAAAYSPHPELLSYSKLRVTGYCRTLWCCCISDAPACLPYLYDDSEP